MTRRFPVRANSSRALLIGLPLLGLLTLQGTSLAGPQELSPQPAPVKATPDPNQVMATVGPLEITHADVQGEYERLIPWNYFHGKVPQERRLELRIQARDALLEKALVFQDAQDRRLAVDEADIRERLTATLKDAGKQYANIDDEQFELLFQQYRPNVLRRILIERNEARFEESVPPVTEEDLKVRYEELKGELYAPAAARFQMVQFDVDPSQRSALMPLAQLRAAEFRSELMGGKSFTELIKKFAGKTSSGGDGAIDFVTERRFPVPELGAAAFLLKDGETSEVLDSIYGVHIVRRLETRPRRLLGFEEARPQLQRGLKHIARSMARKAWLDGVRAKYPIKILVKIEG